MTTENLGQHAEKVKGQTKEQKDEIKLYREKNKATYLQQFGRSKRKQEGSK